MKLIAASDLEVGDTIVTGQGDQTVTDLAWFDDQYWVEAAVQGADVPLTFRQDQSLSIR